MQKRSLLRIFIVTIFVLLIALQWYRPHKNIQVSQNKADLIIVEHAPPNIAALLKKSCYDCHSNFTDYPWYANIAPMSWYVDDHVQRGKVQINFSEWGNRLGIFKSSIRTASIFDIQTESMPVHPYTILNPEAKLSEEEKKQLVDWFYSLEIDNSH